jgi:cystathionine beta-synthase
VYDTFKYGAPKSPAEMYLIEGIGEDFIPDNYDFEQVDDMVQVEDKESFLMTRELLTREGIYSGVSSGSAFVGTMRWLEQQGDRMDGKNVLIIFPDSGDRYTSQINVADSIDSLVDTSIEFVTPGHSIDKIFKLVTEGKVPLITDPDDGGSLLGIITDIDLLNYLGSRNVS